MEYQSNELLNAKEVKSSITYEEVKLMTNSEVVATLRKYFISSNFERPYECGRMGGGNSLLAQFFNALKTFSFDKATNKESHMHLFNALNELVNAIYATTNLNDDELIALMGGFISKKL